VLGGALTFPQSLAAHPADDGWFHGVPPTC
jgi:hypothetical protein